VRLSRFDFPCVQSLDPVRKHRQQAFGLRRVIGEHVNPEVVWATHVTVHQELHRELRALAGLEGRRTDGRDGRSTPLDDFHVGGLRELERLIADVRQDKRGLEGLPEADVAKVDRLAIDFEPGLSGDFDGGSLPGIPGEQRCGGDHDQDRAEADGREQGRVGSQA
jgi:hypothetical protein